MVTQELEAIKHEERNHCTLKKCFFTVVCFVVLLLTQMFYGGKASKEKLLPNWARYIVLAAFVITMLLLARNSIV